MALEVSPELREILREPFGGGEGNPGFSFREIEFIIADRKLLLVGVAKISYQGSDETWRIPLSFEEEDYRAALASSPRPALEWFAMVVRENVIEWWHTRRLEPNMPFPARRLA
ncbi:hypothetical protein [Streptomyces auratus]|uniref:Uncharacterized protein n=1 Tax=Streptomyces auratus AGR0001 TaxID=1160718 RepID=A0A8B1NQU3_9ACTN|nr:hypothetical protein [Streptomyces auratus]QTZ90041.1 hypothetical protein SU9_000030 [Streptomyces auratus AGR0001]